MYLYNPNIDIREMSVFLLGKMEFFAGIGERTEIHSYE